MCCSRVRTAHALHPISALLSRLLFLRIPTFSYVSSELRQVCAPLSMRARTNRHSRISSSWIRYSTTCFGVHTVTARQTEGSILADRPSPTPIRPHLRGSMNYPLLFHISIRGLAVPPRNPSASPSEYEPLSSVREAESLPFPLFFFL